MNTQSQNILQSVTCTLPQGKFPTEVAQHLKRTDNNVNAAILEAALDKNLPGHDAACRITEHDHYKVLYQRHPDDVAINPDSGKLIFEAAKTRFESKNVRRDSYQQKRVLTQFPVLTRDGRIVTADKLSEVLQSLPIVNIDYVYVNPDVYTDAKKWLEDNRSQLITQPKEES